MTAVLDIVKEIKIREEVCAADVERVRSIVASSGFFRPDEVAVAVELVDERLARGSASGYRFVFAEMEGETVGYACYGPIACTVHSYDIFWIAVQHDLRGQGLGKYLLQAVEARIARLGGRRIYIETSTLPQYEPTRHFYLACGYKTECILRDFYAPGDSKMIFVKVL